MFIKVFHLHDISLALYLLAVAQLQAWNSGFSQAHSMYYLDITGSGVYLGSLVSWDYSGTLHLDGNAYIYMVL
jgi:hypothetical protein